MTVFGLTDRGIVRAINQDALRFWSQPENDRAIVVLCDGMGGEQAGEIASALAVEAFFEYAEKALQEPEPPLAVDIAREASAYANLQVYDRANRDDACHGMGTTLVAAIVNGTDTAVVNVGDSRCYWLAEGQLVQVTRDHSWVQELVDQGAISADEARSHPRRNLITRALGLQRRSRSDIYRLDFLDGDVLLLCSDGLSNQVTEQEMTSILSKEEDDRTACEQLLALALQRGAPDNVTVLILRR